VSQAAIRATAAVAEAVAHVRVVVPARAAERERDATQVPLETLAATLELLVIQATPAQNNYVTRK